MHNLMNLPFHLCHCGVNPLKKYGQAWNTILCNFVPPLTACCWGSRMRSIVAGCCVFGLTLRAARARPLPEVGPSGSTFWGVAAAAASSADVARARSASRRCTRRCAARTARAALPVLAAGAKPHQVPFRHACS